jgi:hypothetical protein
LYGLVESQRGGRAIVGSEGYENFLPAFVCFLREREVQRKEENTEESCSHLQNMHRKSVKEFMGIVYSPSPVDVGTSSIASCQTISQSVPLRKDVGRRACFCMARMEALVSTRGTLCNEYLAGNWDMTFLVTSQNSANGENPMMHTPEECLSSVSLDRVLVRLI